MTTFQALVLAFIQGFSEFIPVSSSAHLIIPGRLFGWPDQGLAFDVTLHVATLLATVIYFRRDLLDMVKGSVQSVRIREMNSSARLAFLLIVAVIPTGIAGLAFHGAVEQYLRSDLVIACTTLVFGLLLWYSARWSKKHRPSRPSKGMTVKDALIIGTAQAISIIPGTSRSGITLTAGLLEKFSPGFAAKFSFLLSIPTIALAGGYEGLKLVMHGSDEPWDLLAIGFVTAFVTGLIFIKVFMNIIERIGVMPFVIYRMLLSAFLFLMISAF